MWTITEKQYTNEDGESYTGYGVEFGKCLVEDITPSRTAIQQFADALKTRLTGLTHRLSIFMR